MTILIYNSTIEFLTFTSQTVCDRTGDEVETSWSTQELIAEHLGVDDKTIREYLISIFQSCKLGDAVIRKPWITANNITWGDAKSKFQQFCLMQNRLFESIFDKILQQPPKQSDD